MEVPFNREQGSFFILKIIQMNTSGSRKLKWKQLLKNIMELLPARTELDSARSAKDS